MLSIGLTGGIGSGKTFVANIIKKNKNFIIFDSDLIAKKILNNDLSVKESVKSNFGKKSYLKNKLNSKFISDIVFVDQTLLEKLNDIVHPKVIKEFKDFKSNHKEKITVIESALLFETGFYQLNDVNILITCPVNLRLNRIMKRDNIRKEHALKIISSQWKDSKKIKLADFVIDNIDKLETENRVKNLIVDII